MAAWLIDAGDDAPPAVQREGRVDFIPVVQGSIHADNILNMAEFPQQRHGTPLFQKKLLGIGQVLELTAAAFFVQGAGGGFVFTHRQHLFFSSYHSFARLQSGTDVLK